VPPLVLEAARKPTIIYRLSCARESNQLANHRIDTPSGTLKWEVISSEQRRWNFTVQPARLKVNLVSLGFEI
jgi:hypothetical protein